MVVEMALIFSISQAPATVVFLTHLSSGSARGTVCPQLAVGGWQYIWSSQSLQEMKSYSSKTKVKRAVLCKRIYSHRTGSLTRKPGILVSYPRKIPVGATICPA